MPTEETSPAKPKKEILKKIMIVFFALLILFNTFQLYSQGNIVERVDHYNKGLVDEVGGIREDVIAFEQDMNEMRKFLLMPPKDYAFQKTQKVQNTEDTDQGTETKTAVYTFMTSLVEQQKADQNSKTAEDNINILAKDNDFIKALAENDLKISNIENNETTIGLKIITDTQPLFSFFIEKKSNTPKIQSVIETVALKSQTSSAMAQELIAYCKGKKEEVLKRKVLLEEQGKIIEKLADSKEIADLLKLKKITFNPIPTETETEIVYSFQNNDQNSAVQISILKTNGHFKIADKSFSSLSELQSSLSEKLKNLDTSSLEEKIVQARRAELEAIFQEEAFKDLLKNNQYTLTSVPREEANKLVYDIKKADGAIAFSFVIEISSGSYKILKDDQEIDLFSAMEESGSKKKP